MYVIRLADGTLRVPRTLTSEDGRLIANAYVDLVPGDPDYDRWLPESLTEEELAERRVKWQAGNDELEREFQAYRAEQLKAGRLGAEGAGTSQEEQPVAGRAGVERQVGVEQEET
ncbi:hypothetical protein GCM10010149_42490 [Nonomuraea roseoviolacea subsp. roseoviolacea]|uniref:Uncharacterized protein n=1 Tax=Nonomuraea roseoviolacea subsp. carminata TaxID=160689 RepID=A0ABT1JZE0_9ACTN|nr:hypothetical protein [Nonomuraea roseoviolacea]MCP2346797.1 hypothetical protein [Nonomuraea roseoviolacea subsp. carminata]